MYQPFFLNIALRYTRSKKGSRFISLISLISIIGIALGVSVLITVLSVMNGFDHQIKTRFFGLARQVTILSRDGKIDDWKALSKHVEKQPHVLAVEPFVHGNALLKSYGTQVQAIMVNGINPKLEAKISKLKSKMILGSMDALQPGQFGILIGKALAAKLGVGIGSKISVFIPRATVTPLGAIPNYKRFTVVGIFEFGRGFGFDDRFAFMHIQDAQKLYQTGDAVTGLFLKIDDLYLANPVATQLVGVLSEDYLVQTWADQYGPLFEAIKTEKTMMFIILLLIIAVAGFNLISSLVMLINEKRSDIAILRTYGATPNMILKTFLTLGTVIGFTGTLLGLLGGILLSLNVGEITTWIEHTFNIQLLASNVYYVNYLPSRLMPYDVIRVCSAALLMSVLFTLYPAISASRVLPAEALRYE